MDTHGHLWNTLLRSMAAQASGYFRLSNGLGADAALAALRARCQPIPGS